MSELDTILAELDELKASGSERYPAMKQECEASVARWEWTTSERYNLEPYFFERHQISRGRVLKEKPSDLEYRYEYGFDGAGRVRVARKYLVFPSGIQCTEHFYLYRDDTVDVFTFEHSPTKALERVQRFLLDEGRVRADYFSAKYGQTANTYVYEGGRLVKAAMYNQASAEAGVRVAYDSYLTYDGDKLDEIARVYMGGSKEVVYRRRPKEAKTLKSTAIETITAQLSAETARIVSVFREENPSADWYAFLFTPNLKGDYLECAFGTEQALQLSVEQYEAQGYETRTGDSPALLREMLRWNPWDGYRSFDFDKDGALGLLRGAYDDAVFTRFGSTTISICTEALRRLDEAGHFGIGTERERIAIGVAIGENDNVLLKSVPKVNPVSVAARVKAEIKRGYKVELIKKEKPSVSQAE